MAFRIVPSRLLAFPLLLLGLVFEPSAAFGEDEAPKDEAPKDEAADGEEAAAPTNPLRTLDEKEAKPLAKELAKAARRRDAKDILPVLDKIADVAHEDFDKPLLRLLKHDSGKVATRVVEMWEWRVRDEKVAKRLWKATWEEKANRRRYVIKAKALKALARGGFEIDDRKYKEIERDWRWIEGNPDENLAPALAGIADWVALTKDKRMFRHLAEELDEPGTDTPNAPSNPPASWWKKRWHMWKEAKPAIVAALHALTGKEFDKLAEAKAWLEEHGKDAGIEW